MLSASGKKANALSSMHQLLMSSVYSRQLPSVSQKFCQRKANLEGVDHQFKDWSKPILLPEQAATLLDAPIQVRNTDYVPQTLNDAGQIQISVMNAEQLDAFAKQLDALQSELKSEPEKGGLIFTDLQGVMQQLEHADDINHELNAHSLFRGNPIDHLNLDLGQLKWEIPTRAKTKSITVKKLTQCNEKVDEIQRKLDTLGHNLAMYKQWVCNMLSQGVKKSVELSTTKIQLRIHLLREKVLRRYNELHNADWHSNRQFAKPSATTRTDVAKLKKQKSIQSLYQGQRIAFNAVSPRITQGMMSTMGRVKALTEQQLLRDMQPQAFCTWLFKLVLLLDVGCIDGISSNTSPTLAYWLIKSQLSEALQQRVQSELKDSSKKSFWNSVLQFAVSARNLDSEFDMTNSVSSHDKSLEPEYNTVSIIPLLSKEDLDRLTKVYDENTLTSFPLLEFLNPEHLVQMDNSEEPRWLSHLMVKKYAVLAADLLLIYLQVIRFKQIREDIREIKFYNSATQWLASYKFPNSTREFADGRKFALIRTIHQGAQATLENLTSTVDDTDGPELLKSLQHAIEDKKNGLSDRSTSQISHEIEKAARNNEKSPYSSIQLLNHCIIGEACRMNKEKRENLKQKLKEAQQKAKRNKRRADLNKARVQHVKQLKRAWRDNERLKQNQDHSERQYRCKNCVKQLERLKRAGKPKYMSIKDQTHNWCPYWKKDSYYEGLPAFRPKKRTQGKQFSSEKRKLINMIEGSANSKQMLHFLDNAIRKKQRIKSKRKKKTRKPAVKKDKKVPTSEVTQYKLFLTFISLMLLTLFVVGVGFGEGNSISDLHGQQRNLNLYTEVESLSRLQVLHHAYTVRRPPCESVGQVSLSTNRSTKNSMVILKYNISSVPQGGDECPNSTSPLTREYRINTTHLPNINSSGSEAIGAFQLLFIMLMTVICTGGLTQHHHRKELYSRYCARKRIWRYQRKSRFFRKYRARKFKRTNYTHANKCPSHYPFSTTTMLYAINSKEGMQALPDTQNYMVLHGKDATTTNDIYAIIDSGAPVSVISQQQLATMHVLKTRDQLFNRENGGNLTGFGKANLKRPNKEALIRIRLRTNKKKKHITLPVWFVILDEAVPTLIGHETLKSWEATINVVQRSIYVVSKKGNNHKIPCMSSNLLDDNTRGKVHMMSKMSLAESSKHPDQYRMSASQRDKLNALLEKYDYLFTDKSMPIKTEICAPISLHLKPDHKPYRQPQWRNKSPSRKMVMQKLIQDLLDRDVIEELPNNASEWRANCVLVQKPNGKWRMTTDYSGSKGLNSQLASNIYNIPTVGEQLDPLKGNRIFSSFDLADGFWQVPLAKESRAITAFWANNKSYQYKRLPMGLANSPMIFQQIQDSIYESELKQKFFKIYIDDAHVFSPDMDSHLVHLEKVFKATAESGNRFNIDKVKLCRNNLDLLGFQVTGDGLLPCEDKVAAMTAIPTPYDKKSAKRFVCCAAWYRSFIPNFSDIAAPIRQCCLPTEKFKWTTQCEDAFNKLKQKLTSSKLLAYPDFNRPFHVYTDASDIGVGAVLCQPDSHGMRPIAYASKKLNRTERNWDTRERECYAVVWAVTEKFKYYLQFAEFTVFSDHKSLQWLLDNKEGHHNGKIERWRRRLTEFSANFTIQYKEGRTMHVPDMLSRAFKKQLDSERKRLPAEMDPKSTLLLIHGALQESSERKAFQKQIKQHRQQYTIKQCIYEACDQFMRARYNRGFDFDAFASQHHHRTEQYASSTNNFFDPQQKVQGKCVWMKPPPSFLEATLLKMLQEQKEDPATCGMVIITNPNRKSTGYTTVQKYCTHVQTVTKNSKMHIFSDNKSNIQVDEDWDIEFWVVPPRYYYNIGHQFNNVDQSLFDAQPLFHVGKGQQTRPAPGVLWTPEHRQKWGRIEDLVFLITPRVRPEQDLVGSRICISEGNQTRSLFPEPILTAEIGVITPRMSDKEILQTKIMEIFDGLPYEGVVHDVDSDVETGEKIYGVKFTDHDSKDYTRQELIEASARFDEYHNTEKSDVGLLPPTKDPFPPLLQGYKPHESYPKGLNQLYERVIKAQNADTRLSEQKIEILKMYKRWKQTKDHSIKAKLNAITKDVVIEDDLLKRRGPVDPVTGISRLKAIIPDDPDLKQEILGYFHNDGTAGHFGPKVLAYHIQKRFLWKSLTKDCKHFVQNCLECQMAKSSEQVAHVHMTPMASETPFRVVQIDLLPRDHEDPDGYDNALTIIDMASRYTLLIPVKSKTTDEIAWKLHKHLVCGIGMGAPELIICDRGGEFRDRVTEFAKSIHCRIRPSSAYTPAGHGLIERVNRTLNQEFNARQPSRRCHWRHLCPEIQAAINFKLHESIGISPCEYLRGITPRMPVDNIFSNLRQRKFKYLTKQKFREEYRKRLERIRYGAIQRNETSKFRQKAQFDKHKKEDIIPVKSKVLFHEQYNNDKANVWRNWTGPYEVEKYDPQTHKYQIRPIGTGNLTPKLVPRSRIRKVYTNTIRKRTKSSSVGNDIKAYRKPPKIHIPIKIDETDIDIDLVIIYHRHGEYQMGIVKEILNPHNSDLRYCVHQYKTTNPTKGWRHRKWKLFWKRSGNLLPAEKRDIVHNDPNNSSSGLSELNLVPQQTFVSLQEIVYVVGSPTILVQHKIPSRILVRLKIIKPDNQSMVKKRKHSATSSTNSKGKRGKQK